VGQGGVTGNVSPVEQTAAALGGQRLIEELLPKNCPHLASIPKYNQ
jgi:hypothetical protein